jgi:branched-chain amino acid aminotransferase
MAEMEEISLEVARRNWEITGVDMWLDQRISRGVPRVYGGDGKPTLIIDSSVIPFAERAEAYRDGMQLLIPTLRRIPPWALSPRAKALSRLNLLLAQREIEAVDPKAWPIMLDEHGNLAESAGANIFAVRGRTLVTPSTMYVLPGMSRQVAIELGLEAGLKVEERDLDMFEALTADEIFITSTSLCICPVASINAKRPRNPEIPGPVTRQLQDGFRQLIDFDFVGQYLSYLHDVHAAEANADIASARVEPTLAGTARSAIPC